MARMGCRRDAYRILVRKFEGSKPVGKLKHSRWEDNIKMEGMKLT
jgi:hypothetical protein